MEGMEAGEEGCCRGGELEGSCLKGAGLEGVQEGN